MKYAFMFLLVGVSFLSINAKAAVNPFECKVDVIYDGYFDESLAINDKVSYECSDGGVKQINIGDALYIDGEDSIVIRNDLSNKVETYRSYENGYEKITVTNEGTIGEIIVEYKFDDQETPEIIKVAKLEECSSNKQ